MTDFRWLPAWIALTLSALAPEAFAAPPKGLIYDHVLLISVDGLHAVDLSNYITANPNSTLATIGNPSWEILRGWPQQPPGKRL